MMFEGKNVLAKIDLASLSSSAVTHFVTAELGEKPFRAKQLFRWIHQRGATSFDEMTKGIKITDVQMAALNITRDEFHGEWNYTINPRT